MKLVKTVDDMTDTYGEPHEWDRYIWWINDWRLICETIVVRLFLDVALRCPHPKLVEKAREKLKGLDDLERIDREWPGHGSFVYDWEKMQ